MAVRPRYIKPEANQKTDLPDGSPVATLLYLSRQGIVFESRRRFDTGIKLALGLHLDQVRDDLGLPKPASFFDLDPFLDVEGFVADCKVMEVSPAGATYQVTLLFDGLDEADEMLIEAVEREFKLRKQPPPIRAPRHEAGLN